MPSMLPLLLASIAVALSITLQGCSDASDDTTTTECVDPIESWVSSDGKSCADYVSLNYCTSSGGYGSGWLTSFGSALAWGNNETSMTAWDACCKCGAPLCESDTYNRCGKQGGLAVCSAGRYCSNYGYCGSSDDFRENQQEHYSDDYGGACSTTGPTNPKMTTAAPTAEEEEETVTETSEWSFPITISILAAGGASLFASILCAFKKYQAKQHAMIRGADGDPLPAPGDPAPVEIKILGKPDFEPTEEELQGFSLEKLPEGPELEILKKAMVVTDPHNLGQGRDVREANKYSSLSVEAAWRVSKPEQKVIYEANRRLTASAVRRVQATQDVIEVTTKLDDISKELGCDEPSNERILLHGTKPDNVVSILWNGLSERLSGGLFGCGIYLTEDASKMDQYCTADDGNVEDENVQALHDRLWPNEENPFPGGKLYYCFLVRAALGCPVFTKDGEKDMASGNKLWVRSDRRELTSIPGVVPHIPFHSLIAEARDAPGFKVKRHREILTFNGDRTLVNYLIAFRRER